MAHMPGGGSADVPAGSRFRTGTVPVFAGIDGRIAGLFGTRTKPPKKKKRRNYYGLQALSLVALLLTSEFKSARPDHSPSS